MGSSTSTRLARDVRSAIPGAPEVAEIITLREADAAVWAQAAPHLRVRDNDGHTLHAYGIARALLAQIPDADPDVVLPAILLHDTGWSTVPDELILEAIAPGGGRPDLVRRHEVEGARIARENLTALGRPADVIDRVTAIIDGHDSRLEALSIDDAVVKDADKIWRVTPHGLGIVAGWFSLSSEEALRITGARTATALFTPAGRAMAAAFIATASISLSPEFAALPGR